MQGLDELAGPQGVLHVVEVEVLQQVFHLELPGGAEELLGQAQVNDKAVTFEELMD